MDWIRALNDTELVAESTRELGVLAGLVGAEELESIPAEPLTNLQRLHLRAWLGHRHLMGKYRVECELSARALCEVPR